MIQIGLYKKLKCILIWMLVWLLVFQAYLGTMWDFFSYTDEFIAITGGVFLLKAVVISRNTHISKDTWMIACLLVVFIISGLLGNIVYQYQPMKAVVVDLVANTKFYFSILTGYFLFQNISWERIKKHVSINLKVITILVFGVFIIDRLLNIYPGEIRYGIKSVQLFFPHSTYFAGAIAFLIVMLTVFYDKNSLLYILLNLAMLGMTLRSKALASVAVYIILFYIVTAFKKKIKITDIILLGIGCFIIAWPMINFYYIQLSGWSARSVMTSTSFEILKDYFPLGTGFATYGTDMARVYYSPVYVKYGFMNIEELAIGSIFLSDTFWPIIIAQTGLVGTFAYLGILYILLKKSLVLFTIDRYIFLGALFALLYLVISSTAEPIFNNLIGVPLALALGCVFCRYSQIKADKKKG